MDKSTATSVAIKLQKQNVGNAGEYFIASRLSALDYTVTITLGRAERYDLLALSPKGKLIKISVKTTQLDNSKRFPLSQKDEQGESDDFYYAFVKLNNFVKEPDVWIIPSTVVCPLLKHSNDLYLKNPGKKGQLHNASTMRILPIEMELPSLSYPNWEKDIQKYYMNFRQLESL
ncbi:group I intron-associated PD-(D/E)XK endonuclease [Candidatus Dojkabacteria bacterium]|jgi:hypothetical protein|nr:group I intron-associated PD-(D/E)XK endonuclease [Candidatus Dojkabacteria bacterium]